MVKDKRIGELNGTETMEQKKVKDVKSLDPFDISLKEYRSLDGDEQWTLTQRLYDLYGDWVQEKFEETKAKLLVICQKEIIYQSANEYDLRADKVVRGKEKELGKPCYILTNQSPIEEEASWSDLREIQEGDYYPTIEVYLGTEDEEEIFGDGTAITSDFDTGNPDRSVFPEAVCREVSKETMVRRRDKHLGRLYHYYLRPMAIGVMDRENQRSITKPVQGIENWEDIEKNPYRLANPNREGFIGRDLMLELSLTVSLNPREKRSKWELI